MSKKLQNEIEKLEKENRSLINQHEIETERLLSKIRNLEYKLINKNKEIGELKDLLVEYFRKFVVEI
jgi:hypothetical protein